MQAKALYAMYQREAAEGKKRREQMIKYYTITVSMIVRAGRPAPKS